MGVVRHIHASAELALPFKPAEVWAVLADVAAFPAWWPSSLKVTLLKAQPGLLGTEIEIWSQVGGAVRCRFEEPDEPHSLRIRFRSGALEGPGILFLLEASGGGTTVGCQIDAVARRGGFGVFRRVLPLDRIHESQIRSLLRCLGKRLASPRTVTLRVIPGDGRVGERKPADANDVRVTPRTKASRQAVVEALPTGAQEKAAPLAKEKDRLQEREALTKAANDALAMATLQQSLDRSRKDADHEIARLKATQATALAALQARVATLKTDGDQVRSRLGTALDEATRLRGLAESAAQNLARETAEAAERVSLITQEASATIGEWKVRSEEAEARAAGKGRQLEATIEATRVRNEQYENELAQRDEIARGLAADAEASRLDSLDRSSALEASLKRAREQATLLEKERDALQQREAQTKAANDALAIRLAEIEGEFERHRAQASDRETILRTQGERTAVDLQESLGRSRKDADHEIARLKETQATALDALQAQAATLKADGDQVRSRLSTALDEVAQVRGLAEGAAQDLARETAEVAGKGRQLEATIEAARLRSEQYENELTQIEKQSERARSEGAQRESALRTEVATLQKELETAASEAQEESARQRRTYEEDASSRQAQIAALEVDLQEAQKGLKAALTASETARLSLAARLQEEAQGREEQHRERISVLEASLAQIEESVALAKRQNAELQRAESVARSQCEALAAQLSDHEKQLDLVRVEAADRETVLRSQARDEAAALEATLRDEEKRADEEAARIAEEHAKELTAHLARITELVAERDGVESRLEAALAERARDAALHKAATDAGENERQADAARRFAEREAEAVAEVHAPAPVKVASGRGSLLRSIGEWLVEKPGPAVPPPLSASSAESMSGHSGDSILEIARRYFEALSSAASPEEIAGFFAANARCEEFPHRFRETSISRGLKGIMEARARDLVLFGSQTYELRGAIGSGSQLATEVRFRTAVAQTGDGFVAGQEVEARCAILLTFDRGWIMDQRIYACFEPWSTASERDQVLRDRAQAIPPRAEQDRGTARPAPRGAESNIEIARRYWAALNSRADPETISAFYAADAVQEEFPNRLLPHGAIRNLESIRAHRQQVLGLLSSEHGEIRSATAGGSSVAVEVEWTGVMGEERATFAKGERIGTRSTVFLQFRNGRIVSQRNYACA